jgi:PAS domain S-box-containing protein
VFDENGKCLRVIGTAIDITAHKLERARQALLVELGERLRMLDDPDDLAFAAAELLGRAFNVSRAGYGTIDPVQETITIERDWNAPSIKSLAGTLHFRDYGSYIEALKRGVTVTIPDAREDPRTAANAGALEAISARALINMPVTEQGGFVALLYLNHESVRAWTEEDIALIREVAERTRVAVERRRVEAALQRSEEQLRLATDYAEVGLWDIDTVKDIVYWPPRVHAMFGTEPGTPVTMKQFRGAIHPDDKRRVIGAILQACDPEKRTLYDCEYRVVRGDGTQRWLAAKGRAIFDETGRCIRMLGIILDITGRREIEEQARASEARFRALFESIDDGFCIIEAIAGPDGSIADFRYIEENPALAKRSGIMGVLGHTIREMLPVEADAWIATLAGVLESGEPLRFERFLETSGRLLELFVLRVGARSSNQVAVLFQDITERRAAEQQLHEMNETLERRVAERTAALERSQAALQQAQKMEAIGNLTGGIAHDFNNLLQGVTGSLDLIRRKPDNIERVRHWAESGLQAAERGAKLTAQLLAFSRSQKLELKPVDLSALLTGMRDLMERTLGPSVRVRLDLDSRASNVMGDETQLELAVLNLAINARDAMAEGGELVIATRGLTARNDPELAPGEYIALSVADTGAGMAPDIAARAFDPFFTTKGVGKGTGLGLSQVYGMARQAGGIARIRSTAGQGTTISIFLPITDAAARPDIAHSDNGHARSAVSATILVVDDDADVRRFLADALDALGYAVMLAEDGPSCLDTLSRSLPDLMIVDYAMPEMTGAEVAHKARARHPGLPILFASGYAETSALEDALDGGTQVLRKPFRMNELQDAIIRALRH